MLIDNWLIGAIDILPTVFTAYIFFFYFNIFFEKKKRSIRVLTGIIVFVFWQLSIPEIVRILPAARNIGVTVGVTLFAVISIFEGKIWKKCFFVIIFDAVWMLVETLVNNLLMLYCEYLAVSQRFGAFVSKLLFFAVILALKKIFTNEEIKELPAGHNILLVFIPVGSIYIMNAVFTLAYSTSWEYAEVYSLMSVVILLVINVLGFYVYIKLADDLQVKRMNVVYEQQLELCERHQEETEISMLQIRDVRHSMRNHFISILAYAERGECDEIIQFVDDVIEDGKLELSGTVNTGNIVTDSLVGYWERIAEQKGIEFRSELSIPMEMPFKGADISLILGNLLENAVEGAGKAEKRKYIRLKIKYDKKNLLIMVENSYKGKLVKGRGEELRTTKTDKDNHGIGLSSVRRVVGKYHGTVSIDDSIPECFVIRMVLYGE
ncbi:GHKL domain-containing protein [Lachnospiraceae bacterium 210521-DFI.5.20]|jgi:two-component system sensor histidine kinase AgrC|uniref:sensor histidine kinase n=1 Tax=Blautia glucerasea TaxID=536633 RepID=UPI001D06B8FD|nr:sensor histidine kinase [Blautia glucerasea]MCB6302826.1 GHKL domain-containing protein [Lachnospiraceae bacterium 210521-DFI.5.20]MCB6544805.1 GHKL domain-containing protein [Blautia glucerasea]MCB6588463.1 GHKL domain-containing protein [bacterium 210702-DFI.5.13]